MTKDNNMPTKNGSVRQWLHPESLMDEEYEEHELDLGAFTPPAVPWTVSDEEGEGGAALNLLSADGRWKVRVQALDEVMLRLRVMPVAADGSASSLTTTEKLGLVSTEKFTPEKLKISDEGQTVRAERGGIEFRQDRESGDFSVFIDGEPMLESADGGARFSAEPPEHGGVRSFAAFRLADEEEAFWGFGGRVRPVDRRGSTVDIFSEKVGKKYGDYGGFPLPYFISSRGYGVFLNNPWPHVYFDMGASFSDRWFLTAPGGEFDLFIIRGPAVADIVQRFTALCGRIDNPQKFLFGFWVSSLGFETSDYLLEVANRLRQEDYPTDNLVLDGPWRGGPDFIAHYKKYHEYMNNDLQWHPDFGDGIHTLERAHEQGFKLTLHLNSRIFTKETVAEALSRGLLRQHGEEVVIKLEDKEGEEFFLNHLRPRIEEGVDLWWTDHTDRVSGEIKPGVPSRNLFGPLWNRFLAKAMAAAGKGERLSLSRGGGIGSQRYALPWPGDTESGIERFAEDVWFCLNAGLSGFPITSVDMGGFTLPRNDMSEEEAYESVFGQDNLHRRLFQSIMFIPAPRIHNNHYGVPRLPWQCPEESQGLYRQFLHERYRLTPYFHSLGLGAADSGEPIMRPLFYHFQNDPRTHRVSDVFMVGDRVLFAPVFEAGARSRRFYLPAGGWYNYWNGEFVEGGREVEMPCPTDRLAGLPMLIRAGSILPLQTPTPCLDEDNPKQIDLIMYPDADGRAQLDLRENGGVNHRFTLQRRDDGNSELHLENRTDSPRTYRAAWLRAPHLEAEQKQDFAFSCVLEPGETKRAEIQPG